MQFLHDDVILEIWITPEMEADSEAHFVVLERLNLKTEEMVEFIYIYYYYYGKRNAALPTSRSVM